MSSKYEPVDDKPPGTVEKKKVQKPSANVMRHLGARAIIQVFLTILALGTAIVAFVFSIMFRDMLTDELEKNYKGILKSDILPCIRSTLEDQCANDTDDQCWDKCCPPGYTCSRSPTVGLYCKDATNLCGGGDPEKFIWCLNYADIPGICRTEECLLKSMVFRMTLPAYFLSGVGMVIDVIDGVFFFAAPNSVACKACINLSSSCIKWIAFGVLLGAGAQEFMAQLYSNICFNREGMFAVRETGQYLISFVITQVISALLSLIIAPISAYYGGKLVGVPYVK